MLLFCTIFLILNIFGVTSSSECLTPNNKTGNCIPLLNCAGLLNLIRGGGTLKDDQREFLKSSQCGRDDSKKNTSEQILVCCENTNEISLRSDITTVLPAGDKLPEAPVCGMDFRSRILGGNSTQIDQYPWMALLQYKKSENDFDFHCGGSLINSRYVLTAAHCIENAGMPKHWILYAVRLGEYDTATEPDCKKDANGKEDCAPLHRDILIEQAIKHENYLPDSHEQFMDIGLLRLVDRIEAYTDFIKPICLPFLPEIRSKNYVGANMDVAGWGITELGGVSNVKLTISIPVWNASECNTKFASYNVKINDQSQLCAGGLQGIDTCRGDSGGPLMVIERVGRMYDAYFQIGIVSYGPRPCGLKTWPGVYTRVTEFVDWIRDNLRP